MDIQCSTGNWATNLCGCSVPSISDASWTPAQVLQISFSWAVWLASHPKYLWLQNPSDWPQISSGPFQHMPQETPHEEVCRIFYTSPPPHVRHSQSCTATCFTC